MYSSRLPFPNSAIAKMRDEHPPGGAATAIARMASVQNMFDEGKELHVREGD